MPDQPTPQPSGKTPKWLKGATYTMNTEKWEMIVDVPKSATAKRLVFYGKDQCDLVQCMFDELVVRPNQPEASGKNGGKQ